ncbi:MAG: hypothetical protein H0T73_21825 [Ardenticatenales bacterium]|nr:hypothetical protein [Ardenticatenales bacterium]
MLIEPTEWSPPDGSSSLAALRVTHADTILVVVPERGGKLVSLVHKQESMEWLWLNPYLPWRTPSLGDSYVQRHDLGGWDECFPTVAPTVVNGVRWPDHGDLWWRPWQAEIRGDTLWMGVEGAGYRFERLLQGTRTGMQLSYSVTNLTSESFPYLWCAHPLFHMGPAMLIEVAGRPDLRLGNDSALGAMGEVHRWPTIKGRTLQQAGKPSGLAAKLFLAVETGEVLLSRPDHPFALALQWPIEKLPFLGLWLNEEGWSGAGTPNYCNLGIEPSNGAPDDLAIAYRDWKCAGMLAPGGSDSWWLHLAFVEER